LKHLRRLFFYIFIMLFLNCAALFYALHFNVLLKILITAILLGAYVYYNVRPRTGEIPSKRLKILIGGYELILVSAICFISEFLLYILFVPRVGIDTLNIVINGILCVILIAAMILNGYIRIFTASTQLGAKLRLYLICLWWFPIINIVLFYSCCKNVRLEYEFEVEKYLRNVKRKDENVCKTKYPILMVHGIFFRDWKLFGYWGRIPSELIDNGAAVYFGNQQSSSSVEQSANEIKKRIAEVLKESGCDKVNIIAHSKGGLDARYAISCLEMGQYVASLTTINTPHMGSAFAGKLIEKIPDKFVSSAGKKYEALFAKLGDDAPDFFGGVSELTVEKCAELNKTMVDYDGVVYQSAGSKMRSRFSAPFPLNAGYSMIEPLEGENDGLVATKSMACGNFLGIVTPPGKLGISHGDMIDLTRKNIYGFDVCEFYVKLVNGLKTKGL